MKKVSFPQIVSAVVLVMTVFILGAAMARYWPLGADYFYSYHPVAKRWLDGKTQLYDENALQFFIAPWSMFLLAPLTYLPFKVGQTVLNMTSLLSALFAAAVFRRERPVSSLFVLLAIANMHTLDLLSRGQVDGLLVLAIVLGWLGVQQHQPLLLSVAFCLLGMKPPNVVLAALLFLFAIRDWPRRDVLVVFSLPALAVLSSPLIAGIDWPLRYITYIRDYPVAAHRSITIWKISSDLGLPLWPFLLLAVIAVAVFIYHAWRQGLTHWTLSLAVSTNLLFAYYANGYHYLLLIPAFVLVAHHHRALALLAYLATFTPAVRVMDATIMHWDYLYPMILFMGVWMVAGREPRALMSQSPLHTHHTLERETTPSTPV